jgi:predicted RNA-binding Zn-ribbon protein involved in translation (DUF1610 family)
MARHEKDYCWRCGVQLAGQRAYRIWVHRAGRPRRRAYVCAECGWHVVNHGMQTVVVDGVECRYALA